MMPFSPDNITAGYPTLSDLTTAQALDLCAYLGNDQPMDRWTKLARFSWEATLERSKYMRGVAHSHADSPTDLDCQYKEYTVPAGHPTQTHQTIRTLKRMAKVMESLIHAAKENPQVSQHQLERAVRHIGKTITEAVPPKLSAAVRESRPVTRESRPATRESRPADAREFRPADAREFRPAVTVVNDQPTPGVKFYVISAFGQGTAGLRSRPRVEITAVYHGSMQDLCKQMNANDPLEALRRLGLCMDVRWADKEFGDKLAGWVSKRPAE